MVCNIITMDGDINLILRKKSIEVAEITPSIIELLDDMMDTIRHYKGWGLSAPQIGVGKRAIVIDTGKYLQVVNPYITGRKGNILSEEECLSVPGTICRLFRSRQIHLHGIDRHGNEIAVTLSGPQACIAQHEVDHLDGILFTDKAVKRRHYNRG